MAPVFSADDTAGWNTRRSSRTVLLKRKMKGMTETLGDS
jgi:nitrous oxide reductase